MQKLIIPVKGMHCRSCELTLEKLIGKLDNVKKVSADQSKGQIEIEVNGEGRIQAKHSPARRCENEELLKSKVEEIIVQNGYEIGKEENRSWLKTDINAYIELFFIAFIIYVIYFLLKKSGIDLGGSSNMSSPTLGIIVLIGLTAGFSSCMALVSGLVLAVSAKINQQKQNLTAWQKFYPHIFFNLGRVVGFIIFGGVLGAIGSVFNLSITTLGILTLIVGGIMLLLGINLIEISPKLANVSITLPKFFGKNISGNTDSQMGAMITGALTFFLPCGFTLAMQVYAMSSGSALMGAGIMGAFALGTLPGIMGVGGLTSLFKGNGAKRFFRITGVIVILLSIFNISNALNLLKGSFVGGTQIEGANLEIQEVRMDQVASGYKPNVLTIQAGKKVRWIINSQSPYNCSSWITIPSLNVSKQLVKGENIVEFVVPDNVSEIPFSCIMGMYTGKFMVEKSITSSNNIGKPSTSTVNTEAQSSNGFYGCNMMGDGTQSTQSSTSETTKNTVETNKENTNVINLQYTSNGLEPATINLESGKSYKLIIDPKVSEGGCMSTIVIPGLDNNIQYIEAGKQIVFNISPKSKGNFPIVCAMGVPHGEIYVN